MSAKNCVTIIHSGLRSAYENEVKLGIVPVEYPALIPFAECKRAFQSGKGLSEEEDKILEFALSLDSGRFSLIGDLLNYHDDCELFFSKGFVDGVSLCIRNNPEFYGDIKEFFEECMLHRFSINKIRSLWHTMIDRIESDNGERIAEFSRLIFKLRHEGILPSHYKDLISTRIRHQKMSEANLVKYYEENSGVIRQLFEEFHWLLIQARSFWHPRSDFLKDLRKEFPSEHDPALQPD